MITHMTDKELKRLSRTDMMQMILDLTRENEALRDQLREAESELRSREIEISESGTLAEAALKLSGIFEAADIACMLYTENMRKRARLKPEKTKTKDI